MPAALAVLACLTSSPAQTLTIYRIGGESLEPPTLLGTPGVEFVQRSWVDVDEDSLGSQSLTQPGQEFLTPVRLRNLLFLDQRLKRVRG